MSNLIPSSFQRPAAQPTLDSQGEPVLAAPPTDCQMCRVTGTATFSAVGCYALVQARTAKTAAGRGLVVLGGLGQYLPGEAGQDDADYGSSDSGFLTVAAARWTQGERLGLGAPPKDA